MKRIVALVVGLGLMLAVTPAIAVAPTTMNFQGRLTDTSPSQTPIDVTLPMEFHIYDALAGGSLLWSEAWGGITVSDGLFSVVLGNNGTPLTELVFDGPGRYLEIVVNSEVLSPRQTLAAVGFAQQATNSDSLGGNPAASWQMSIGAGCAPGSFVRTIHTDGSIVCAVVANDAITSVTAGEGLTGGGTSGAVTLNVDFQGDGASTFVARSDHIHGGGPVPPMSATYATLQGGDLAAPIYGWISGENALSTQSVGASADWIGITQVVLPVPTSLGLPESDPKMGVITFTTLFTVDAPLLEWMEDSIQQGVPDPGGVPPVDIILFDSDGGEVLNITLSDPWPRTWSLDYLSSGEPIVHIDIAGTSMAVQ